MNGLTPLPFTDIVDFHGILFPISSLAWIERFVTKEASTNSHIKDEEKVPVEGLSVLSVESSPKVSHQTLGVVHVAVDDPLDLGCAPVQSEFVEIAAEVNWEISFTTADPCMLVPGWAVMKGSLDLEWA